MKNPYLYLFALSIICTVIALFPSAKALKFIFSIGATYYVFSLNSLCWGIASSYLMAGLLCLMQTFFKAGMAVTKIHFLGSLLLPFILLLYKTLVWYKQADRSNRFNNPFVDFDYEYGNLFVFFAVITFCVLQVVALANIISAGVRTLKLKV